MTKAVVKEIQVGGGAIVTSLYEACLTYIDMVQKEEMPRTKINFCIILPNKEVKSITIRQEENEMKKDATKAIMKLPGPAQIIDPPEIFKANMEQRLSRCQYHWGILAGDEVGDWCTLKDCRCGVAYGSYECKIYNKLKGEK